MIQMGALDDPPAHAMRSLSSALTERKYDVPTNITAKPRTVTHNLHFISLPFLPCHLRFASSPKYPKIGQTTIWRVNDPMGTVVLSEFEFKKKPVVAQFGQDLSRSLP